MGEVKRMFDPKDILRFLFSFLLIAVLVFFQSLIFVEGILLNPNSYFDYINTPLYYEKLRAQIDFGLEEVGRFSNVPGEVLTSSVTDMEIKEYTQTATKEMLRFLKGESSEYTLEFNTEKIKSNLETYVKDYASQRNQPYSEELQKEVIAITKMAGDRIETYTMIIDPTLLKELHLDTKIQTVLNKIPLAMIGSGVSILLLSFLLWLTNRNHRMRTLWWVGSSLGVSSIVLLIPGITVSVMNVAGRIGLTENYLTWVLERSINSLILKWNLIQFGFLILGILLMISYLLYRKMRIKSSLEKKKKRTTVR